MHDLAVEVRAASWKRIAWSIGFVAAPLLGCPIDDLSEGALHDASTAHDATVPDGEPHDTRADTGSHRDAGHDAHLPRSFVGLFDGKSFQGLNLNDNQRPYPIGSVMGAYCDIVGIDGGPDLVYANTEPRSPYSGNTPNGPVAIWGGLTGSAEYPDSMQLSSNAFSDFTRDIEDASTPSEVSDKVLALTLVAPDDKNVGDAGANAFNFFNFFTAPNASTSSQGMLYFSRWMWLQGDMDQPSRTPFENFLVVSSSTGAEQFTVGLVAEAYGGGGVSAPGWYLKHESVGSTYRLFAAAYPSLGPPDAGSPGPNGGQVHQAPVPLATWFRLEVAWNRRDTTNNNNGWIWMALTVPNSSDEELAAGVTVYQGFGSFAYDYDFTDAGRETIGWNALNGNDPTVEVTPIQAYSDIKRSQDAPFTQKLTNVEVWTQWPPSGATAHPPGLN
jgi:hypothetical protein